MIINQATWINEDFIKGLVSVIIPVYTRNVLIKKAIESIYNQSYRPIECIVIDDGSTDNTDKFIRKFAKKKKFKIKYLNSNLRIGKSKI